MNILETYGMMKRQHPDAMLLFRNGDFYELLNDDARNASEVLGITVYAFRSDAKTAVCGFPYHALDNYLPKLIRAGYRIAICDMPEDNNQNTKSNRKAMKLSIRNNKNNESANVQNAAQVNNHVIAAAVPVQEPAVEDAVAVEVKDEPETKPSYSVSEYTTKKGRTAYLLFGFESKEQAENIAAQCSKTISASWRSGEDGQKRYCLSLGTRYGDVAKAMCDALNNGDGMALATAMANSCKVYEQAVSAGRERRAELKAKMAEKKAGQEAKAEPEELPEKSYTESQLREMFKRYASDESVPELEALMCAA